MQGSVNAIDRKCRHFFRSCKPSTWPKGTTLSLQSSIFSIQTLFSHPPTCFFFLARDCQLFLGLKTPEHKLLNAASNTNFPTIFCLINIYTSYSWTCALKTSLVTNALDINACKYECLGRAGNRQSKLDRQPTNKEKHIKCVG
jgi:hypothetical protein